MTGNTEPDLAEFVASAHHTGGSCRIGAEVDPADIAKIQGYFDAGTHAWTAFRKYLAAKGVREISNHQMERHFGGGCKCPK